MLVPKYPKKPARSQTYGVCDEQVTKTAGTREKSAATETENFMAGVEGRREKMEKQQKVWSSFHTQTRKNCQSRHT